MNQHVRYCTTADGARLAYSLIGEGSPVVRTSHWLTHLQHDLSSPVWKHVVLGLAARHTLVRYDPRGEGMSQRSRDDISFEAWLADLDAVVEAAGHERFALFGCSQGAATAIAYAVRHPERVTHLILYGGFARGLAHWGEPEEQRQELELARSLIRQGWGKTRSEHRQWFTSRFLPDGTAEQYRWFNRMQQVSATPQVAERHLTTVAAIDVTALLPQVTAPTLVLHSRGDAVAPFELGEELAASIPGAKFVPLDGNNHLFLAGTDAHREFLAAVYDFLGDAPPGRHLPGTMHWWQRLEAGIVSLEQHGLVKVALLAGGLIGLGFSLVQLWHYLR